MEVGAFEAKNRLSELLRRANSGEDIEITNRGRIVARLVPPRLHPNADTALAAVERIKARRKGVTLRGLKIKDLIEEGRR